MNDYELLAENLQQAIIAAENAYYSAQDSEDEADIDRALDILKMVEERAKAKA